jgi:hypothetical protein
MAGSRREQCQEAGNPLLARPGNTAVGTDASKQSSRPTFLEEKRTFSASSAEGARPSANECFALWPNMSRRCSLRERARSLSEYAWPDASCHRRSAFK